MMRRKPIVVNTASIRECFTTSQGDGVVTPVSISLIQPPFDRARAVAAQFQEYRVKYIKLTFRPSADTFPIAAGNIIPNLYFQLNKYQAISNNIGLQNLLDLGCRPIRFDDKNIVRAWRPTVLLVSDQFVTAPGVAKTLTTPWLSTNANAESPTTWAPSEVEHLGAYFYIDKPNPATPTIDFNLDVEVVWEFRRPNSQATTTNAPMGQLNFTPQAV